MQQQSHNHHYVPVWYQKRFLAPARTTFKILDLRRDKFALPDGRVRYSREILDKGPNSWFKTKDLYTVSLFGRPNDEIERMLFGVIDSSGRRAIDAWLNKDWNVVHDTYWQMYEFMDALRLRTPKGLRFVKALMGIQGQPELMYWMQSFRRMHCVMWAESVLEILSAKESPIKFIFSDHPVTFFNRYVFPGDPHIPRGFDPRQEWLGTQTLFPFDQENLFVLTHLEWARKPGPSKARRERTNARYFDNPLVRFDKCLRDRTLTEPQVREVNYIIKARAERYIAGRTEDDLYPERHLKTTFWSKLGQFLAPKDRLYEFGGDTYVAFNDGRYYFQDEFGRRPRSMEEYDKRVQEAKHARAQLDEIIGKHREHERAADGTNAEPATSGRQKTN